MTKFDVWTLRATRALFCGAIALTLTACGGGGGSAGTPVVGPGSGASSPSSGASAVAADLVVVLSKNTLNNSTNPADSITATVTSIDADRAVVGNVPVSFSADANAVVTPAGTATNATSGILTATITQGSDASVRPVNLTVKAGSISRVVTFNVVQASSTTNPQASDLSLTLSATSVDDSGGKTVVATATAVDANRNALSGIPVQLAVTDASASIVVPSTQTDANGRVTGTVSIGQDRTNRQITVTATSGTLVKTAAFQVTGAQFTAATPLPAVVQPGDAGKVNFKLSDTNGNPLAGVSISVSGTGVSSRTGKTDLNGGYVFDYIAPNTPGASLLITAQAGGAEPAVVTVTIPGGTTTVPTATAPVSTTLNLSSNVVSVNSGQSSNQVAISAFFRDGSNAPIKNVRVLFGVTGDNQTGTIGSGNTTVLSDASGTASGTYAPGSVSSPTNGVSILACWKTTDFASGDQASNCAAAGGTLMTTPLTIVSNPVSISIGTDNKITAGPSSLTYLKKYVVLVVDSAGNPKAGVQVTPSVDLGGYGKGKWDYNAVNSVWERRPDSGINAAGLLTATCPNEDLNRNGVIDSGEDVNGSQQLDPRKSDVSITLVGSTTTDANGVAVLQLEYPQNIASWVKYKITVTAAGVLSPPAYFPLSQPVNLPSQSLSALLGGGSSVEDYLYTYDWLPVNAQDLTSKTVPPAFANSPYGVAAGCTNTK